MTNSSGRIVVHLYTSPPDRNEWSADHLPDGSNLGSGATFTLSGFACGGDKIKVVAEDKDGPAKYKLNKDAAMTVLVYKQGGAISKSFAFKTTKEAADKAKDIADAATEAVK